MAYKPLITKTPNPAPSILTGDLVLYQHTWIKHIQPYHPEVLLGHVRATMDDPCEVVESATVPGDYLLLNKSVQTTYGATLRVAVRPQSGTNIVTSAYPSTANNHGKVVWTRGDD